MICLEGGFDDMPSICYDFIHSTINKACVKQLKAAEVSK